MFKSILIKDSKYFYYSINKIVCRLSSAQPKLTSDDLRKKIIYNTLLVQNDFQYLTPVERRKVVTKLAKIKYDAGGEIRPAVDAHCLKYLEPEKLEPKEKIKEPVKEEEIVKFPYQQVMPVEKTEIPEEIDDVENMEWKNSSEKVVKKLVKEKNWLPHDPNMVNDAISVDGKVFNLQYGSADPSIPVSSVPCGGCGALLHCQDTSIPGFLPKELFYGLSKAELKILVCQRCHYLKEYDIALGVDVPPEEYPKILAPIKSKKALVLLMVDLLDIPCSIWPGLLEIIGEKRPVVVVANKIDLLVEDGPELLNNIRKSLMDCLLDSGLPKNNIKHIAFISAKSGYGVENLITQIHSSWRYQGDIYIVGCTNVGKSTLFNTLIQSDLCKVQAVDLMQRATVSEWPGTTLNLLRFPILRPSHWRLFVRKSRMIEDEKFENKARTLRSERLKKTKYQQQSPMSGNVGRSFVPECPLETATDPFAVAISNNPRGVSPLGLNPDSLAFKDSKWCYDTPGVVHPDQILNLLTTPEILATLPKRLILPRVVHLQPGFSILIAGLARMDYISGPDFVWLTVFASESLPLTITRTEDMDDVYNQLIGTELLKVPNGGSERLSKWPALQSKDLEVSGEYSDEAAADVVLSSAGWVAVTLRPAEFCNLRAWTPEARGIHLRPPFLKKAHKLKGPRIPRTPVFSAVYQSQ